MAMASPVEERPLLQEGGGGGRLACPQLLLGQNPKARALHPLPTQPVLVEEILLT